MKLKIIFRILLTVASMNAVYSQQAQIKKANKSYENYAFVDAIKTYERIAEKGYKDVAMFQKLGNAYYFNAELDKANKWYTELFNMTQDVDPEYYYRYSQTLKSIGEYVKANEMLDKFNIKSGNDLRATLYEKNKDYLKTIEENSGRYSVENSGINSEYSDYGTSFFGNQLVFASTRISIGSTKRVQKWNNQAFTSLYTSTVSGEGQLQAPEKFDTAIDSKFNEATPTFTKDSTTMYFTRNNYNDGKERKNNEKVILLKLYRAKFKDGKYTDVTELPFNSDQYSTAHPVLSPDEKTLYFASDMPGSLGQSDLYKVAINADGTFGTPENLGNTINTEGKETFPFVSNSNELYFSSDGHPGLGGLDIFVSKINGNSFEEVINVGAPVNGNMDDFAFMIDSKTPSGFFSSNRDGGHGSDDIYKFKELKKLTCEQLLSGTITDALTGEVLAGTKVTLFDETMNVIAETYSDAKGYYLFGKVLCRKEYHVRAEKEKYVTTEKTVIITSGAGETVLPLTLEKIVIPVKVGDDLAKVFKIKIIYFDLDKSNIREDAAFELAKIVDFMLENPTVKVDVRSHTDSRGSSKYNKSLSERRAKSTADWMIGQGIDAGRLTSKGYGETQLVNKCADGVPCTEEEHQMNRRTEFIITEL